MLHEVLLDEHFNPLAPKLLARLTFLCALVGERHALPMPRADGFFRVVRLTAPLVPAVDEADAETMSLRGTRSECCCLWRMGPAVVGIAEPATRAPDKAGGVELALRHCCLLSVRERVGGTSIFPAPNRSIFVIDWGLKWKKG